MEVDTCTEISARFPRFPLGREHVLQLVTFFRSFIETKKQSINFTPSSKLNISLRKYPSDVPERARPTQKGRQRHYAFPKQG